MMSSAILILLAAIPVCNSFKTCKELGFDPWMHWNTKVKLGQRNYVGTINPNPDGDGGRQGRGYRSLCFAKGNASSDEILDPTVTTRFHLTGASMSQISTMPCKGLQEAFSKKIAAPAEDSKKRRLSSPRQTTASGSSSCEVTNAGFSTKCEYPVKEQSGWGLTGYKISQINPDIDNPSSPKGKTSVDDGATIGSKVTQYQVYGSTLLEPCKVNDESVYFPSGIVQVGEPIPNLKIYSYRFASDAEREAALLDERNPGLKYAKNMKGANGCDTELVYAFSQTPRVSGKCQLYFSDNDQYPCTGGGAFFEMSTTYESLDNSEKKADRYEYQNGIRAYQIPENNTVVIEMKKSVNRKRAFLPVRPGCDDGYEELMRFANVFTCKNSGNKYVTKVLMSVAPQPARGINKMEQISTNKSTPTYFNPGSAYDLSLLNYAPDFVMTLDNVTEDCGEFYWDPLIASTPGDGKSASAGGLNAAPRPLIPGIPSPFGFVIVGVVGIVFLGAIFYVATKKSSRSSDANLSKAAVKDTELA